MIIISDSSEGLNAGLNKLNLSKIKKHLNLKNAVKLAVAPHALLLDAKKHKGTFAKKRQVPVPRPHVPVPPPHTPVNQHFQTYEEVDSEGLNAGLNKSKFLKKINLKGAIKGIKTYAPMALSLIPVAGGAVSGVAEKLLKSKAGQMALKVSNSKVGKAVKAISKTDFAKNAVSRVSGSADLPQNYTDHTDPAGELTAVKAVDPLVAPAKNNTMLYLGGAVALGAIGFFAMRKK